MMFCSRRSFRLLEDNMFVPEYRKSLRGSVLEQIADDYVAYLQEHSYCPQTARAYLHGIEHFAGWLTKNHVSLCAIDERLVHRFIAKHLPTCKCKEPCQRSLTTVRPSLTHLLHVLRAAGSIKKPQVFPPEVAKELHRFDEHLHSVCGLAQATRISRRQWVGRFLVLHFDSFPVDLSTVLPKNIVDFIARSPQHYQPGSLRIAGCALRSYLRFRSFAYGDNIEALLAAIPRIAKWSLDTVPKYLTIEQTRLFLQAFDHHTYRGRRDYAMARCLLDMGLRAAETAAMQLDDLNWRDGTLTIPHGKGRRADVLPLPATTGRALVAYLKTPRPSNTSRAVFVRQQAPYDLPITTEVIRGAMRRAFVRCGLEHLNGTHVLRHTAAVRMRSAGATLKEIADVLRHRSLDTTMIYSKVDLPRLSSVAKPWPGGLE